MAVDNERIAELRPPRPTPYDRLFQHLVPQDHELFAMARAVDWEALTEQLAPFYADVGRPAFPAPAESTIADFRNRLGDEGARIVFDAFNRQRHGEGLIGTSRRVLDDVHILGKVARRSLPEILDAAVERLLDALDRPRPDARGAVRERPAHGALWC